MYEPHQFERDAPLKNQRENSMYTIKNAKIEIITYDGNGAYLKRGTNKQYYCLLVKNGRVITKMFTVPAIKICILIKGTDVITKLYR